MRTSRKLFGCLRSALCVRCYRSTLMQLTIMALWMCRAASESGLKHFGHDHVPGVQLRLWGSQGSDIFDSLSSPKHQSAVTELEVKLREALDKCNEATSAHLHEEGTERGPHKLRTAVCCQLLQELSHMAGPYSGVLKKLCHELVRLYDSTSLCSCIPMQDPHHSMPANSLACCCDVTNSLLHLRRWRPYIATAMLQMWAAALWTSCPSLLWQTSSKRRTRISWSSKRPSRRSSLPARTWPSMCSCSSECACTHFHPHD